MFKFLKQKVPKPIVVTFTGGMGAQMISAAIYFQMKAEGKEVYADFSYFRQAKNLAIEGIKGDVSHWDWQLTAFNLKIESFSDVKNLGSKKYQIIIDGAEKMRLGLNAFKKKNIQNLFLIEQKNATYLVNYEKEKYLCIHMRRGDYLNVSSHVVSDDSFKRLAERFSNLMSRAVVVSDSAIPESFKSRLSVLFPETSYLDDIDEYQSHCIMRCATVLICSNSQFSLVAAMLNTTGLVLLPKTWFGIAQPELELVVSNLGTFQILD